MSHRPRRALRHTAKISFGKQVCSCGHEFETRRYDRYARGSLLKGALRDRWNPLGMFSSAACTAHHAKCPHNNSFLEAACGSPWCTGACEEKCTAQPHHLTSPTHTQPLFGHLSVAAIFFYLPRKYHADARYSNQESQSSPRLRLRRMSNPNPTSSSNNQGPDPNVYYYRKFATAVPSKTLFMHAVVYEPVSLCLR